MEFITKYYPQILIAIGIVLQLLGGTAIYVQTKKSNEENKTLIKNAKELGDENKELSLNILSLSNRISEQSKIIENQITGGDSYGIVEIMSISDGKGDFNYVFSFENKGDYPLTDVSIRMLDRSTLNKTSLKERDGMATLEDLKNYKTFKLGNVGAHLTNMFSNIFTLKKGTMHDFGFSINTKNKSYSQQMKFIKTDERLQKAIKLNTVVATGKGQSEILVDKADDDFPNVENGKIKWE